jgi:hypothetical protein
MSEPREWTEDEVRENFLRQVWAMIDYWNKLERDTSPQEKLEGLAHSIFVMLDGGSGANIPGFIVAPCPHPDDEEFHKERGENWYPTNHESNMFVDGDIGGCIHEMFYKYQPEGMK